MRILNENLTYRCTETGHFFPKSGQFFHIFKNGQGRPPLSPQLVVRLNILQIVFDFTTYSIVT